MNTIVLKIQYMGIKSARLTRIRNNDNTYQAKKILKPKLKIHFRLTLEEYNNNVPIILHINEHKQKHTWTTMRFNDNDPVEMAWHRYYKINNNNIDVICQTSFFPCKYMIPGNINTIIQIVPQLDKYNKNNCNTILWNTYDAYIGNIYKILLREFNLSNK